MQYSIPPWHYTNSSIAVNKICKDLIDLREALVYPVLIKEADNAVKVGSPIIRPMWWLDNTDQNLYNISDQFLVGNEILVAPMETRRRTTFLSSYKLSRMRDQGSRK
jgi:alpha-glucosidase (family GH31 glycosyl hydrolase)